MGERCFSRANCGGREARATTTVVVGEIKPRN
jgi:hypothetical protein